MNNESASDLPTELDLILKLDLDVILHLLRKLTYDPAHDHEIVRIDAIIRDIDLAQRVLHDPGYDRNLDRKKISQILGDAFEKATGLENALALDRPNVSALIRLLAVLLNDHNQHHEALQSFITALSETPVQVTVASLAQRLIGWTMQVLPAAHRKRYAEELHSELWDLAAAKATQSMQVLYAIQQLSRVWQIRCELRSPGRRRVEVLRKAACWVLASQAWTWGLISFLTIAALFDVAVQQGPGSAFFAAPTLVTFYMGVEWLRKRWGVTIRSRKRPEDE